MHGVLAYQPSRRHLDEKEYRVFCYLACKDENQQDDCPAGYVPLDFENKPEAWAERRAEMDRGFRITEQYGTPLDIPPLNPQSLRYLEAVQQCDVEAARAALAEGGVDPLCRVATSPTDDRTTIGVAIDHVLSGNTHRSVATQCLELVLAQPGLDVSMDHFHGRSPPSLIAVSHLDTELARMLLEAGARTSFEDVFVNWQGLWMAVARPRPGFKPTLLHYCAVAPGNPPNGPGTAQSRVEMAKLLVGFGVDVNAVCSGELPQVGMRNVGTALELARRCEGCGPLCAYLTSLITNAPSV